MKKNLQKLGLTPDNSIVIGSGILQAFGIRRSKDIDVVVIQAIYDSLKKSGRFTVSLNHGREILKDDIFEIGTNWVVLGKSYKFEDFKNDSVVIDGIRYITIEFLHKVKKGWVSQNDVRQKDIEDIKLIEKYLNKAMKKPEEKTLRYYDKNAQEWGEAHHGFEEESFWKSEMQRFHELLPYGKVLEIGSGTGKDASNLIKIGYDYVGTDASRGLMALAKKRNPGAIFKNIRVQDLANNFLENEFDGFWTAATLLHIPKNEIDECLQNIRHVIRNEGLGFITVKQGRGEKEDETGRLFSYYSQNEFTKLLTKHGFEILDKDIQPISEKTIWLVFLVQVKK